ncbi:MAG TPA: photosynthetic reaction center cytochrome c subunit family protein [Blastocatellia bacterium]|nr:photosynthetic reaction center cytochrome c subunit family protein [Blastocatellia bacterium]
MRRIIVRGVMASFLIGSAIALLLVGWLPTTAKAGFLSGSNSSYLAPQAAQGSGPTAGKNPYIAALEKQIAGRENKPAEEVFKNIQLLKGMTAGRILRVMDMAFSTSLGVDCTHCHIADQWEKDDKEAKQTARKMWQFMGKVNQELKQAIGKGQVNCTTCHRGQVKPALGMPPSR